MNPELQGVIANILGALQKGAVEYGPKALELALEIRRFEGIGRIASGLIALLVFVLAVPRMYRAASTAWKAFDPVRHEFPGFALLWTILTIAIGLTSATTALVELTDIWNWVAVFRPDIALAHDILVKVTK